MKMTRTNIFKSPTVGLLAALLLVGCAGMGSGPQSNYDRFTGTTINSTRANDIPSTPFDPGLVTLDMRQEIKSGESPKYYFALGSFSLQGWALYPNISESLLVLADGQRFAFSTSFNHQGAKWFYPATAEQLKAIGHAKTVEVRIVQAGGVSFERKLAAQNVKNFRDFVDKYLIPAEQH